MKTVPANKLGFDDNTCQVTLNGKYFTGIESDGDLIVYYRNGWRHRSDGPAEINLKSGEVEWYLNGYSYYSFDFWCSSNREISDEDITLLKLEYG